MVGEEFFFFFNEQSLKVGTVKSEHMKLR